MKPFNYYDKIAPIYEQTRWMTESIAEEVADFILELVGAKPDTSFLEPAVGTGLNVFPFVQRGYPVTGIDLSLEMLKQFRQKLNEVPDKVTLIHGDASQLSFQDHSFDVVLTAHMIHTVANWKVFLDEIMRVLKPKGFYLNAQWITPPARREFENYFRAILSKYNKLCPPKYIDSKIDQIDVNEYFCNNGYSSKYFLAKEWTVTNTVEELLSFLKSRAYGLCWSVTDEVFHQSINEFEEFCSQHYGLTTKLSSNAKFEIWAYTVGESFK